MPKILFIQPTQYRDREPVLVKQRRLFLPGLAFPLLAALTPPRWTVELCLEVIEEVPFDTDAEIIGIGGMGQATHRGVEIARAFKQRGKTVVMGGYTPSLVPEYVAAACDSVVIGDAEIAYPRLLEDYEDGRLQPRYHHPVESLRGLPVPRYELLSAKRCGFMLPVLAGRGCPHSCSYCSIYCLYRGRYLARPVEEVVRDVERVRELGYRAFFLIDDNVFGDPSFFGDLCRRIKPLRMEWAGQCSILLARHEELLALAAESGCCILSLGIESVSQEALDGLDKPWVRAGEHDRMLARIADAGILPATEMIVGTDDDTPATIRATAAFVLRNRIPIPKFYVLTPVPGSELHARYRAEGRLLHEDYGRYTGAAVVHRPARMGPDELAQLYWWLYREVYSLRNIARRTLFHRRFARRPLAHLFALFVNLSYRRFVLRGDAPNVL